MGMQALLVSNDPEALRVVRRVLDELNIWCEAATSIDRAGDLLSKRKFDAVVIDCDDLPGATGVLLKLRQSPSHKRTMAFAIVNGETTVRDAFDLGANFVMDKPLSLERVLRSFRAAHGLMMRERRRYFRNPLNSSAFVITSDGRKLLASLVNLSEGGMALKISGSVNLNSSVRVGFDLPETTIRIEAKAEVCWMSREQVTGIRFLHVEQKMQRELEQWIGKQADSQESGLKHLPIFINAAVRTR